MTTNTTTGVTTMNEQPPSKDQLRIAELEAECNRWADLSNQRDDREHRLRTTLRGIASCSTCERCRGAATLALGGTVPEPAVDVESQEFYELMQSYRHMPPGNQAAVCMAFEAVKKFVRGIAQPPGDG